MGNEGASSGPLRWALSIALLVITAVLAMWHSGPMNRSRTPQQLTPHAIRFVGEQDGSPERELKARLVDLFSDKPTVERAYLARTDYGDTTGMHVALCVVSSSGEDKSLVSSVSGIFADMFGTHEHLDVLFIRDDQEQQLRAVCRPFYKRNI
jgi:hypothetical protein